MNRAISQPRKKPVSTFIELKTVSRRSVVISMLLASLAVASAPVLGGPAAFADSISQPSESNEARQDDYFHTGAGARYLQRADGDIVVEPLRGNITVLMGSGGNITVLSGKEGKF